MTDGRIVLTRTFPASPDEVWRAWTTPASFSRWFGTAAIDVPLDSLAMDVVPGGRWRATMNLPDGGSIHWEGEYVVVDAPSRLVMTMTDEPGTDPGEPLRIDIVAVDGGAELTVVQISPDMTEEQREMTRVGWESFLDEMERVVAEQD